MALSVNFSTFTVECSPENKLAHVFAERGLLNKSTDAPWVEFHTACASDSSGSAILYDASDSSSLHLRAVLGEKERNKFQKTRKASHKVQLLVIDHFMGRRSEPICAVKVDAQGHDFAVLRGAKATIVRHRPVLYFEHSVSMLGELETKRFLPWVRAMGYQCMPRNCLDCHVLCTPAPGSVLERLSL